MGLEGDSPDDGIVINAEVECHPASGVQRGADAPEIKLYIAEDAMRNVFIRASAHLRIHPTKALLPLCTSDLNSDARLSDI